MHKDLLNKIINKPERYLPTIIIFWVLGKTNHWLDLVMLTVTFVFLLPQDHIVLQLAKLVNSKRVEKLLKDRKKDQALDAVVRDVMPIVLKKPIFFGIGLLLTLFFNGYAFCRIVPFWEYHIAKFFIIFGGLAIFQKILFYFRNFVRYAKAIIEEELYRKN